MLFNALVNAHQKFIKCKLLCRWPLLRQPAKYSAQEVDEKFSIFAIKLKLPHFQGLFWYGYRALPITCIQMSKRWTTHSTLNIPFSSQNRSHFLFLWRNSGGGPIRDTVSAKCCSSSRIWFRFAKNRWLPSTKSQTYFIDVSAVLNRSRIVRDCQKDANRTV